MSSYSKTSLSIHGARKITLKAEAITSSVRDSLTGDFRKFAFLSFQFLDGDGLHVAEIRTFDCTGINIDNAGDLDVCFAKDPEGKTRLEVNLPKSVLGIEAELESPFDKESVRALETGGGYDEKAL